MTKPLRVVHYINQFFAGQGGEENAGIAPYTVEGPVGPGRLLEQASQGAIRIEGTVVCGDNYFVENAESVDELMALIRPYEPQALLAGPAFAAGRYGEACSAVCQSVRDSLDIPVITGLAPESPSVEAYRRHVPILRTGNSAADMKTSLPEMGTLLLKLAEEETLAWEDRQKLYASGLKRNTLRKETAAKRAIQMLLAKYRGETWWSEVSMVSYESIQPAPPVDQKGMKIALITDGGLIAKGNPDQMPAGRSKRWCRLNATSWDRLSPQGVDVHHFGYDNRYVAQDPNRLVPLDVMRELERSGSVELHPFIYSTAGVATAIEDAVSFGKEMAAELKKDGVDAVILTST